MPRYRDIQATKSGGATGDGVWRAMPATAGRLPQGGSLKTTRSVKPTMFKKRAQGAEPEPHPLTPARNFRYSPMPTSTRKISASFSTDCPLSGHPTTAFSAVTASTGMKPAGPLTSHPVSKFAALPSSQSYGNMDTSKIGRGLKTSNTYGNLPQPASRYKASPAKPHPASRLAALPSSQSYGNIKPSKISGGLTSLHTYSNLPLPAAQHKASSAKPQHISQFSTLPSSQSHGNMKPYIKGEGLKASRTSGNLPQPVSRHKVSSSKPPMVATAHEALRGLPSRNAENIPPRTSMASITISKESTTACPTPRLIPKSPPPKMAKSRPGIPKSRTFNMFSSLTASLSRTSLSQFTGGDSRRASIASKVAARNNLTPYMSSQSASSTSSQILPNSAVDTADPRLVHEAQSSAYWTGRFVSLQDRFQSEALMPENLETLVHAHAERSMLPVARPSLASSATTSCITTAVKTDRLTRATTKSTTPGRPQQQRRQKVSGAEAAPKALRSTPATASAQPSREAAAALLVDDDNRCRRIFSHLDALCATSEARTSLREWQQSYARRMGKDSLLPEGGTMQGRTRESTWVGRFFLGTSSGHLKRGGV